MKSVDMLQPKETKILFKLSHGEKKLLKALAKKSGISISAYVRLKTIYKPSEKQVKQTSAE